MKVVIVGDGKVGYTLTKSLSEEGHDLVVMSSPAPLTEEEYGRFAAFLKGHVMADVFD